MKSEIFERLYELNLDFFHFKDGLIWILYIYIFVIKIYIKFRNILGKLKKFYFSINNIMILYGSYININSII